MSVKAKQRTSDVISRLIERDVETGGPAGCVRIRTFAVRDGIGAWVDSATPSLKCGVELRDDMSVVAGAGSLAARGMIDPDSGLVEWLVIPWDAERRHILDCVVRSLLLSGGKEPSNWAAPSAKNGWILSKARSRSKAADVDAVSRLGMVSKLQALSTLSKSRGRN